MNNFLNNFSFHSIDMKATNLLPCPDQYVTTYNNEKLTSRTYDSIEYNYDTQGNHCCTNLKQHIIAILLESPHKDEYEMINGVLSPKGPLVGKWNTFFSIFPETIKQSKIYKKINTQLVYNIVFVNAIQYQCSLGKELRGKNSYQKQKNMNVINCWWMGFNKDLEKRLEALRPEMIINLSGKSNEISEKIDLMIQNNQELSKVFMTKGSHPSTWKKSDQKYID